MISPIIWFSGFLLTNDSAFDTTKFSDDALVPDHDHGYHPDYALANPFSTQTPVYSQAWTQISGIFVIYLKWNLFVYLQVRNEVTKCIYVQHHWKEWMSYERDNIQSIKEVNQAELSFLVSVLSSVVRWFLNEVNYRQFWYS